MLRTIIKYMRNNWYELLTVFFLFTNLFPKEFPAFIYYVSFVFILNKMIRFNLSGNSHTRVFSFFIVFLWFASLIGMVLDLRLIIFSTILYMCAPRQSIKWHLYKLKFLKNVFIGFGLATMANFYAKLAGTNHMELDPYLAAMGRVKEFAGFCTHPMWTSAAGAISAMFFISMSFRSFVKEKWMKLGCYVMALISLYVVVISGSRSAFVLSLASSILIVKMQSKRMSSLFMNISIVAITIVIFGPILMKNAGAMLQKKNSFEITTEQTSRDELWSQRMAEFKSSPLVGIGFAAHGVGNNKKVGRHESGGGYISVLSQSGLIGGCFILSIWIAAFMLPGKIGTDPNTILVYCTFVFMTIHSIFEGYLFQAGWYLCLVIWLVVGVLIEHKDLMKKYPQLLHE